MLKKISILAVLVVVVLLGSVAAWAKQHQDDLSAWLLGGKWHYFVVKKGDSFSSLLQNANLDLNDFYQISKLPLAKKQLTNLHIGQKISLLARSAKIVNLHIPFKDNMVLIVVKKNGGFQESTRQIKTKLIIKHKKIVIKNNLYYSAKQNKIPKALIAKLTNILDAKIDFNRLVKNGDTLAITYQQPNYLTKGKPLLLDAKFCHKDHCTRMIKFNSKKNINEYYDLKGRPFSYSFARAPLAHYRVSSSFSIHRWHPILQHWRSHLGVDLAAPSGSKIRATADGRVVFSGNRGGYGRVVVLQHGKKYRTIYAHMSKIANQSWVGNKIKKGQIIGLVGQTGVATGPHCHYEVRVNGKAINPMRFNLPRQKSLAKNQMKAFKQRVSYLDKWMEAA